MTRHSSVTQTGIAWYKPEQWNRLLEISEDRDDLEKTYTEWEVQVEEKIKALRSQGIITEKVFIDVEALLARCDERGVKVSGAARSEYAAWLMQRKDIDT